jgi:hypothetical protein
LATLFSRVAILVKTAAGRLQVTRITRADQLQPGVFLDEGEAIARLNGVTLWGRKAAPRQGFSAALRFTHNRR